MSTNLFSVAARSTLFFASFSAAHFAFSQSSWRVAPVKVFWTRRIFNIVIAFPLFFPNTYAQTQSDPFIAPSAYAAYEPKLRTFGQFVGDWSFRMELYGPGDKIRSAHGEWKFRWILGGRGIQDLWTGRSEDSHSAMDRPSFLGTTVRLYDPTVDAWHIVWIGALQQTIEEFRANPQGSEIVLNGEDKEGHLDRWIFSNIQPNTFDWRAETSEDNGARWTVQQRMWVKR